MRSLLLERVLSGHSSRAPAAAGFLMLMLLNAVFAAAQSSPSPNSANGKAVEDAMGRLGQMQPGDVIRFGMPGIVATAKEKLEARLV